MLDLPFFVQEVIANKTNSYKNIYARNRCCYRTGGEDAKNFYLSGGLEQRMNGTCAGGYRFFYRPNVYTLKTDADLVLMHLPKSTLLFYPIAASLRCFRKIGRSAALNEGAAREDIAASILRRCNSDNQRSAQGRPIKGNIVFLRSFALTSAKTSV